MASSRSSGPAPSLTENDRTESWRVSSSAMRAASRAGRAIQHPFEDQFGDPNDIDEIEDEHDEGGDDDSVIMASESPKGPF